MSRRKCCVPGCWESGRSHKTLHPFPNPEIERDRFNKWVFAIGGDIISLDNNYIYKQRRVCRIHFEEKYLCRNNRISNISIPSLNIPDFKNFSSEPPNIRTRRPLESIQFTPEPLPSTSADLQYDFHAYDDEEKENIDAYPMKDLVEENKFVESGVHEDLKTTTSILESRNLKPLNHEKRSLGEKDADPMTNLIEENKFVESGVHEDLIMKTTTSIVDRRNLKSLYQEKRSVREKGFCSNLPSLKTRAELHLHKVVKALRSKLSKCRKANKVKSLSLKAAQRITSNPAFLQTIEKVPIPGKRLIMMQLRENMKKDKGRRFTFDEKITALSIWKQSPKAYRYLRKIMILPAPQTLTKLLCRANISPGLNKKTFLQLKSTAAKMKPEEKLCILLFDEISLQAQVAYRERQNKVIGFVTDGLDSKPEFADHAQVFMIRGLTKNYKQVLSYTFAQAATKGAELASHIKSIIKELDEAGFTVVATVCDQGTNNRAAVKILTQEARTKFLKDGQEPKDHVFIINDREIVPLYDPPHLMKCVRNNLLTKNLRYQNDKGDACTAKWDHVEELHDANPGYKGIRLIPKLTDTHVIPNKIQKMKVKYATQVFSRTVASNMGYLADQNIIKTECKQTADLLLFFDELFDSVNGSYTKKEKQFAKPLLGSANANSCHVKFWYDAKKILHNMKYINKQTGNVEYVPTLDNWAWTLDGIIVLLNNLKKNYNINSIWMRHLNQDPIENFFGAIRSHGCRDTNLTPDRFSSAFTTLVINNMSSAHAPGANCEKDLCSNLESFITLDDFDCTAAPPPCMLEDIPVIEIIDIKNKIDPRVRGPLEYVTGYFARRVKKNIFKNCEICCKDIIDSKPSDYIQYREYSGRQWLCSPTKSLLTCISEIQDVIYETMNKKLNVNYIGDLIKTLILMHIDFDFLQCNAHKEAIIQYLISTTTNFFIYNYCKIINCILAGKRDPDDADGFQVKAKKYRNKCFKRKKKKL